MVHKRFSGHYLAMAFFVIATFLIPTVTVLFTPGTAAAATVSCSWTDQSTVTCNDETFNSPTTSGSNMTLHGTSTTASNGTTNCPADNIVITNYTAAKPTAKLTTYTATTTGKFSGSCSSTVDTATLSNTYASVKGCSGISQKGVDCASIPTGCPGSSHLADPGPDSTITCPYAPASGSTWICDAKVCNFTNPAVSVQQGQKYSDAASAAAGGTGSAGCGSGSLNWIICPVNTLFQTIGQALVTFIDEQLTINTRQLFGTGCTGSTTGNSQCSTSQAYYKAWNTFRILGTGLIVIAGLVMVASQALGFELLDAYTVRKVLPRLLIAVIGMSLSWPLLSFFINFFNELGRGVQALIYAPFSGLPNHDQLTAGFVSWGLILVALPLLLTPFGAILLPILGTGILALLIGLLILIIRQIAVTLIVILAPLAIAAYVMPNTQKVWKIWYDNFLGLMFMFPIMTAMIAAGQVFSAVGVSGNTVQQLVGIVAWFVPFFLIPLAFRLATGFISTIAGFVNDRSKGGFDRLRNARQEMTKSRIHNARTGNLYKGGNEDNFRGRMNRGFAIAGNINKAGFNPRRMSSRVGNHLNNHAEAEVAEFEKESQAFGAFKGDDDQLWAARFNNRDEIARALTSGRSAARFGTDANAANVQETVDRIQAAQKEVSSEVFQRARVRAQAGTGTAYDNASQMLADINDAYGTDRNGANRALASMRSAAVQSGRIDLGAAGFGTMSGQMEAMFRGPTAAHQAQAAAALGAGATDQQIAARARAFQRDEVNQTVLEGAMDSSEARNQLYGKPQSARQLAEAHARKIQRLAGSLTAVDRTTGNLILAPNSAERANAVRETKQAMASAAGAYDTMGSASPQNAREFANILTGSGFAANNLPPELRSSMALIPGSGGQYQTGNITMLQAMNNLRASDPEFAEMRHDFQSQAAAATVGAGAPPPPPPGTPPGGPPGGAPGAGLPPSDRRLKRNITYLEITNGIPVYRFQYLWDDQVYVGVMAQDLTTSHPEALSVDSYGFYRVNYTMLDLEMLTFEEWQARKVKEAAIHE